MTTQPEFIERSSAVGGHMACDYRYIIDKGIALGEIDSTLAPRVDTPPTAFGQWVHWYSQTALRAEFKHVDGDFTFQGFDEQRSLAAKPGPSNWQLAIKLFSDDKAAERAMAHAAELVIQRLPKVPKSQWMAECAGSVPGLLTGHIDLLSADHEHLVDIKTSGQQPEGGKMKTEHMWQLVAYAVLVMHHTGKPPHFGSIIYVDRHGDWVCRTRAIDFTSEEGRTLMTALVNKIAAQKRGDVMAFPNMGTHCDSGFCPYRPFCRDALVPAGAAIVRRIEAAVVSANPFQQIGIPHGQV
jgi:CRISPR/Cas system-associated exonuclease Cas4 (RecB family)